jgi:hypothetical protein
MVIYTSVITLLPIAFILFETVPMVLRWLNRIHIGRWDDEDCWKVAVKKRLIKQLRKPPRTPGTDCERLRIFALLKHKRVAKSLQTWQHAALLLAAREFGDELCSEASGLVRKTGVWDAQADSPRFGTNQRTQCWCSRQWRSPLPIPTKKTQWFINSRRR